MASLCKTGSLQRDVRFSRIELEKMRIWERRRRSSKLTGAKKGTSTPFCFPTSKTPREPRPDVTRDWTPKANQTLQMDTNSTRCEKEKAQTYNLKKWKTKNNPTRCAKGKTNNMEKWKNKKPTRCEGGGFSSSTACPALRGSRRSVLGHQGHARRRKLSKLNQGALDPRKLTNLLVVLLERSPLLEVPKGKWLGNPFHRWPSLAST